MAEEGNEKAEKATKKSEGSAGKEAGSSPGPAPMGGGDQAPNEAAGSKVEGVGDEDDPGIGHGGQSRRMSSREPAQDGDDEPGS
jgi:hypothetical protein